jgi:hypothetical protein
MGAIQCTKAIWLLRLAVLSLCLMPLCSSAQVSFERTYGGPFWDWGQSIRQTADGGYVIGGMTDLSGGEVFDFYLLKMDLLGDTI